MIFLLVILGHIIEVLDIAGARPGEESSLYDILIW
jgi:hypothetical protein